MEDHVRAHVIIHGHVQGVFFRAETQRAAERIGVLGWARNKSDGTVEIVFEGSAQKVNQAIKWCWQGSPMSKVIDVVVQWEAYLNEFNAFLIKYE